MIGRTLYIDALSYKKNKAFGYQEYLFNLMDYFYENRSNLLFENIEIVCDLTQYNSFAKYSKSFTINCFKVPTLFSRLVVQLLLPFLLKVKKNDTLLFTGNYSSFIKKCKQVLVIHDLLYLRKELLPDLLFRFQRRIFVPRSVDISDVVIAISDFTRKDILNNIRTSSEKSTVRIYNFFNFKKYELISASDNKYINNKYFLCVSSDAYHKNVITILKAYEKFCHNNHEIDLCLVGSLSGGDALFFYNQLEGTVKQRIHLYSCISNKEISMLYAGCEAYISASFFEGLGMPIVEAMYFNVPLILSNLDVCHEVTGDMAVFFNPNSIGELCQIISNGDYKRFDTRSFVLDKYSSANTSQKYIEVLNSL
jgi:glycosyltransferase involved in cell wall biosynthesis